jgi:hypothetical protein
MENCNKKKIRHSDKQNGVCQTRQVPIFDIRQLFGDSREVRLHHCSEEYRQKMTTEEKRAVLQHMVDSE